MAQRGTLSGMSTSTRLVFDTDADVEEIGASLIPNRGHQYTLDVQCDDWTGQQLDLYVRGAGQGMQAPPADAFPNIAATSLSRPVYQSRAETTDRAATDPINENGLYDIRGDAATIVIKATIVGGGVNPITVDVHQLVG